MPTIGLDINHRVFRRQLPRDRADHPHRDRRVETERTAERQHQLSWPQLIRVAEGQRRQPAGVNLQDGEVGLAIDGNDLPANRAPAATQDRSSWRTARRRERQFDFETSRIFHDVRVGHDVPVRVDDHARASAAFERRLVAANLLVVRCRIPGHEYLDDARAHARRKLLQRTGQFAERARITPGRGRLLRCQTARRKNEECRSDRTRQPRVNRVPSRARPWIRTEQEEVSHMRL